MSVAETHNNLSLSLILNLTISLSNSLGRNS